MIVFADFETYWDAQFSLRHLTPPEYILDKRFQVHGCAIIEDNSKPRWLNAGACEDYFSKLSPETDALVTHNALFDACIVAWRYGVVPALLVDTLGMARALYSTQLSSFSLASLAEHFGLPQKGNTVTKTKGLTTDQLVELGLYHELIEYGLHDVVLCKDIFNIMKPAFPSREFEILDTVLRCAVQPRFAYDMGMLANHLEKLKADKAALLAACGVQKPALMSTNAFRALLEEQGVVVETKISTTGNEIPALAKTDEFMLGLTEHENPQVQALAAARLGHKSTIEETRCQRMINIGSAFTFYAGKPCAPMPLRYSAAHTHRFGGDWKINPQNLPRGSVLRSALVPMRKGDVVITADLKQIEARLAAWFCKQRSLVNQFALNLDPYAQLASKIFGFTVDRKVHKIEGFIGKTGILGLGYGAGYVKFHTMVHMLARLQLGHDIEFSLDDAQRAVSIYRLDNSMIAQMWGLLGRAGIEALCSRTRMPVSLIPVLIGPERIRLPNGLHLHYPQIGKKGEWEPGPEGDGREVRYRSGKMWVKIYGAKLLENITQALARIIITDAAIVIKALTSYTFALQAHDELVYVVPQTEQDHVIKAIQEAMTTCPQWANQRPWEDGGVFPALPLGVDIGVGSSYGDAKSQS